MLLLEQREIWGANLSSSEVTFSYGIATPFNVGGVEVNGVDRFVMERAQIKGNSQFLQKPQIVMYSGDRAVDSEEDFHDFTHRWNSPTEKSW